MGKFLKIAGGGAVLLVGAFVLYAVFGAAGTLPECTDRHFQDLVDQAVQDKYLEANVERTKDPQISAIFHSLIEARGEQIDSSKRDYANQNDVDVSDIRVCTPTPGTGQYPFNQPGYYTITITRSLMGYKVDVNDIGLADDPDVKFEGP